MKPHSITVATPATAALDESDDHFKEMGVVCLCYPKGLSKREGGWIDNLFVPRRATLQVSPAIHMSPRLSLHCVSALKWRSGLQVEMPLVHLVLVLPRADKNAAFMMWALFLPGAN